MRRPNLLGPHLKLDNKTDQRLPPILLKSGENTFLLLVPRWDFRRGFANTHILHTWYGMSPVGRAGLQGWVPDGQGQTLGLSASLWHLYRSRGLSAEVLPGWRFIMEVLKRPVWKERAGVLDCLSLKPSCHWGSSMGVSITPPHFIFLVPKMSLKVKL